MATALSVSRKLVLSSWTGSFVISWALSDYISLRVSEAMKTELEIAAGSDGYMPDLRKAPLRLAGDKAAE